MKISAFSVCLVVHPLALIDVSVCVDELTLSERFVFVPVTLVARTIRPHLNAVSFLLVAEPRTLINRSIFKNNLTLFNRI